MTRNISKYALCNALFQITAFFLFYRQFAFADSLSTVKQLPGTSLDGCAELFKGLKLEVLSEPSFEAQEIGCDTVAINKLQQEGFNYIKLQKHSDLIPGTTIISHKTNINSETLVLLRDGFFFGETIEQKFTDKGGHTWRRAQLLVKNPFSKEVESLEDGKAEVNPDGMLQDDPFSWRYVELVEDFLWNETRVVSTKLKRRFLRLTKELDLEPVSAWTETILNRRLIYLSVEEAKVKISSEPFSIDIYYLDPVIGEKVFFRSFAIKEAKQLTVIPFIASNAANESLAVLEVRRKNRVIQKVRITDPGVDNFEIELKITTTPE